ncbi:hypothetical protein FWG76_00625 [Candidatus Saccharibacteria bacterium]|nr:hypothetical protein [Candidatus Saccharibacteria bacterium]
MDNTQIQTGNLSNNALFFGSATSEILSRDIYQGGWNDDDGGVVASTWPWQYRGGASGTVPVNSGVFAYRRVAGASSWELSHRTILLGY